MSEPTDAAAAPGAEVFERYESEVRSYARSFPAVLDRAEASFVYDVDGGRYIDFFAGAGALNYGHNPAGVKAAVLEYFAADRILHALDASTVAKGRFLDAFARVVLEPRGLDYKVQCCGPTGTDAVEAALKLARKVTGRAGVVAFGGSYHGMSLGSMSVTGSRAIRATAGVQLPGVAFVPFPDGPAGPFDAAGHLARLLDDPLSGVDPPAAVIVETVQMEGGVYLAPVEQLRALRALCDAHGALLICDEIQAGCGRTGPFFSFERAGVVPDVVTLSKSISGCGLPMSLVLMRREADRWRPGEHTGTFRGSQLSFVAATAALDFWRTPDLAAATARKGALIEAWLGAKIARHDPRIAVRGIGMAWALDLTRCGGGAAAKRVTEAAFRRGLMIERCGRDGAAIKLLPPLTTAPETLEEGCDILAAAVREA